MLTCVPHIFFTARVVLVLNSTVHQHTSAQIGTKLNCVLFRHNPFLLFFPASGPLQYSNTKSSLSNLGSAGTAGKYESRKKKLRNPEAAHSGTLYLYSKYQSAKKLIIAQKILYTLGEVIRVHGFWC